VEQALPLSLPVRRLFSIVTAYGGGELASILVLYWQQVDEFNDAQHISDEESDAHAAATYEATWRRVIGMPARTSNDALAALGWPSKRVSGTT
jgi:hypothetical protein